MPQTSAYTNNNNTISPASYDSFQTHDYYGNTATLSNPSQILYLSDSSSSSGEYCDDISPEEQQRCPSMLIHVKNSNGVKRKILQDISWDLYHYDGLMQHVGKLFNHQEAFKVVYRIGKLAKYPICNDEDWQHALQKLLEGDETTLQLFIKSDSNKKNSSIQAATRLFRKQEKQKINRQLKIEVDMDNIKNIYIDASSALLNIGDLKNLALHKDKDIAELAILRLAKSLHQSKSSSLDLVHVFYNSTMNVQPEGNEAGTFVVQIAPSFSGDMIIESLNRQIIAGTLESCLVVSTDRVLLKEMNDLGVKVCTVRSWLKICQQSLNDGTSGNTPTKIWLRNMITEFSQ